MLGEVMNLISQGVTFLGGVLIVFGLVNLGMTVKDGIQGGGGQLAGAIAMIVGGGIANTFLKAAGYEVGKSLYEPDLVESAAKIMEEAKGRGAAIPLPVDVVVGPALEEHAPATVLKVEDVRPDDMILDIGPATAAMYAQIIAEAGTVVWNGPVGAFEIDQFGKGTEAIAKAVAETSAYTVTGGGDSIAALEKYGYASQVDYISTAGGAFLEVLEGKTLPAVAALEARAAS